MNTDDIEQDGHEHANAVCFAMSCPQHEKERDDHIGLYEKDLPALKKYLENWDRAVAACLVCKRVSIGDGILCFLNQLYVFNEPDAEFWAKVHTIATKARLRSIKDGGK